MLNTISNISPSANVFASNVFVNHPPKDVKAKKKIEFAQKAIKEVQYKPTVNFCDRIFKYIKGVVSHLLNTICLCFKSYHKKEILYVVAEDKKADGEKAKAIELKKNEVEEVKLEDPENSKMNQLPTEVNDHIFSFLQPKDLKNTTLVNKKFARLSELQKIQWINRNKAPISKIGLNFENLRAILKKPELGEKLEYLEITLMPISQALELVACCPNLRHLILKCSTNLFRDKDANSDCARARNRCKNEIQKIIILEII